MWRLSARCQPSLEAAYEDAENLWERKTGVQLIPLTVQTTGRCAPLDMSCPANSIFIPASLWPNAGIHISEYRMTIRRMEFLCEFESLYRENYSRMYFFSLTIVGEEESARDIVSDVFSKVWDNYDLLDHRNILSYLMTSVRNRSIDHLRRMRRKGMTTDIAHLLTDIEALRWDEEREMMLQRIERDILALPEMTQNVMRLCYFKRMTYNETAEMLGITPRMVKRHISNALARLRERYGVHKKS